MTTLYGIASSGNTYRVRLMLAVLGLHAEFIEADHALLQSADFRRLNPLGEAPVLVDGSTILRDSQAILVYLARAYGDRNWLPETAPELGAVCQWLSLAANEIQNGPRMARAIALGIVAGDAAASRDRATRVLQLLEARLDGRSWLETDRPTVADIACYPYICNANEGGLDMTRFPAVCAWLGRIRSLPGFIAMRQEAA